MPLLQMGKESREDEHILLALQKDEADRAGIAANATSFKKLGPTPRLGCPRREMRHGPTLEASPLAASPKLQTEWG